MEIVTDSELSNQIKRSFYFCLTGLLIAYVLAIASGAAIGVDYCKTGLIVFLVAIMLSLIVQIASMPPNMGATMIWAMAIVFACVLMGAGTVMFANIAITIFACLVTILLVWAFTIITCNQIAILSSAVMLKIAMIFALEFSVLRRLAKKQKQKS